MQNEGIFQKQIVTLEGDVQVHSILTGDENGAPVVLLHGGGTDNAMLSWRDAIPALAQAGYRVYAPDYPGYGDSPPSREPAVLENLGGCLRQLMDTWDVPQAALVGVSMGGALAIGYALEHPERVSRLILVGPYGIQDEVPFHKLSYFLVKAPWLMDAFWAMSRGSRMAARYSLNSIIKNPQSRTDALLEEVLAAMENRHSQAAFSQFQRDEIQWRGVKTNYTSRLGEIAAPALIVHGDQDVGVPLEYARCAAQRLPNGRLEVIPNAGHWTQRDYPERFNRLMLEFLAE
jgi:pimeloyl-ACP methyl ester carboxylesterase